jgi:hypothetical protein
MIIREEKRDLFSVDQKYALAHCVSSDYALGAGIAVEFNKRFNMRKRLEEIGSHMYPECIPVDNVFNLVTKERYWHKPTYESLGDSLVEMKEMIMYKGVKYLAMPRIGSGLDKLSWPKVKSLIEEIFSDLEIEILICYI